MRAGFHADDERHRHAVGGRRVRDVRRQRRAARERLPRRLIAGRAIDVLHDRLHRAVLVERRAERRAIGQFEVRRLADERRLARAGEHRALDRIVRDLERAVRAARRGRDGVRAEREAGHQARERLGVFAGRVKRRRDVAIADAHAHVVAGRLVGQLDRQEHVAPGHPARIGRQGGDRHPAGGRVRAAASRTRRPTSAARAARARDPPTWNRRT